MRRTASEPGDDAVRLFLFFSFKRAVWKMKRQEFMTWSLEVLLLMVVAQCLWRHRWPNTIDVFSEALPTCIRCWAFFWYLVTTMGPDPSLSHCRCELVQPHVLGPKAVAMPKRTFLEDAWTLTAVRKLEKFFKKDHDTEKNLKCLGQILKWCNLDLCWFLTLIIQHNHALCQAHKYNIFHLSG